MRTMTSITWCAQSASVRVQFDERLLQLRGPDIRHRLRVCCPTLAVRVEGELPQGALQIHRCARRSSADPVNVGHRQPHWL